MRKKLNSLSDKETFWDDVRKFTSKITSDAIIRIWEWLSDRRYAENSRSHGKLRRHLKAMRQRVALLVSTRCLICS